MQMFLITVLLALFVPIASMAKDVSTQKPEVLNLNAKITSMYEKFDKSTRKPASGDLKEECAAAGWRAGWLTALRSYFSEATGDTPEDVKNRKAKDIAQIKIEHEFLKKNCGYTPVF